MWVNAEVFMKLVERVTVLEHKLQRAEEEIETLKKRPIIFGDKDEDENKKKTSNPAEILDELLNGKPNDEGRVIYTDGRR